MKIDETLLKKLEKLSFIEIESDKREQMIADLSEVVNFVNNLSELDTSGVSDKFAMSDSATLLREDEASCDGAINEAILNSTPRSKDSFFVVPKIIE